MSRNRGACLALVLVAAIVAAYCLSNGNGGASDGTAGEVDVPAARAGERRGGPFPNRLEADQVRDASRKAAPERELPKSDEDAVVDAWVEALPAADRPLGQRIVDASDSDSLPALKKLVPEVRACANGDVRLRMVEALDWFGEKALVELTPFLSDADADVAQSAFNAWDSAVDQIDDERFRVAVAQDAMLTLADAEMVDNVSAKIKGAQDAKLAVDAVLEILSKAKRGSAADKAARETYEFVTGEAFTDAKDANFWLKENYTPPEDK